MLNAYLMEWVVLTDAARNEAFNACDSSAFTWGKLWPKLAGWMMWNAGSRILARECIVKGCIGHVGRPLSLVSLIDLSLYHQLQSTPL